MIPRKRKSLSAEDPFDPTKEIPNEPFRSPNSLQKNRFSVQTIIFQNTDGSSTQFIG